MRHSSWDSLYVGDLMPEAKAAKAVGAQQRLAQILAAANLANVSGLDVFAVGQHHRLHMTVAPTPVELAAIGGDRAHGRGDLPLPSGRRHAL
jgi:hypothetical protein